MFKSLTALFEQHVGQFADEPETAHALEIAAAALLMEISRADDDASAQERETIVAAMREVFELSTDEIENLVGAAQSAVESAVSIFDFTEVVNQRFSREQKIQLIEMLWRVAYADSVLDRYEEYYVRKIADLLHLSHSEYIRTKLKVMPDKQ